VLSQIGGVPVDLQVQIFTVPVFSAVHAIGMWEVPMCEPSHQGCDLLLPHVHLFACTIV